MGGQACVFYGAAEFSRDTDFVILANTANLARLRKALDDLGAEVIAVPSFELKYLQKGHAVHFRCQHPKADGIRIDVMTKMRGVDSFSKLWNRRTTFKLPQGTSCNLLSLPDLVQAKKTQRDRDWPMLRRLLEAHYFENHINPRPGQPSFWLRELRTPELLIETACRFQAITRSVAKYRPLLLEALKGNRKGISEELDKEESRVRIADRAYWEPLKRELETLRRNHLRSLLSHRKTEDLATDGHG